MVARALDGLEHATVLQAHQIDTLLDLSAIALGRMRLELEPVDLTAVIHGAVQSVRPLAQAKRIALDVDTGMPVGVVSGDSARLGQVLWHLLTNAIRFTPHGGRVSVTLRRSGDRAALAVTDSGLGIAHDVLPYVFDRKRPDGPIPPVEEGPGLGLVLAPLSLVPVVNILVLPIYAGNAYTELCLAELAALRARNAPVPA